MNIEDTHPGQRVSHPEHGECTVLMVLRKTVLVKRDYEPPPPPELIHVDGEKVLPATPLAPQLEFSVRPDSLTPIQE